MPSSASITKVEIVTEAIEALVLASVVAVNDLRVGQRKANHQNVVDARAVLSKALTELVAPTLRLVDNEPQITVSGGPLNLAALRSK